ncbi:DUF1036 domain-containing protein [Aestuariivirga sp.]|uniref:DUF1036 domain-containing protein n=1 Tax=Aestuariivirga sp. TaxID=2650926 RepID=UPI003BAC3465
MKRNIALIAGTLILMGVLVLPARAELKLCNSTNGQVGLAVGYKNEQGWFSEGWWTVEAGKCAALVKGDLIARYYYIYAVDLKDHGVWGGTSVLCIDKKAFTISGYNNCEGRGFVKKGFYEVDTGDQADHTVKLTEDSKTSAN